MTTNTDKTPMLTAVSRRDPSGRFEASLPLHELLDGVAEVARLVAEEVGCPAERVSKAAWDRGRAAAGRPELPTAEGVRKRVGRAWPDVLRVALDAPARRGHRIGVLAAHRVFTGDVRLIAAALRWAALELGHTPRPAEYDLVVDRWNRRAHTDPRRPMLPVAKTIRARTSWDEAIRRAGLAPLESSQRKREAEPLAVLIDQCISSTGVVPTKEWFRQWARVHDVRVGRFGGENEFGPSLEAALQARAMRGADIPDRGTPRPELPVPPSRRRERYTRDDALRALRVYGQRYLRAGEMPRRKHYQVCSAGDPDLITANVFNRFGSFQDLCREVGL